MEAEEVKKRSKTVDMQVTFTLTASIRQTFDGQTVVTEILHQEMPFAQGITVYDSPDKFDDAVQEDHMSAHAVSAMLRHAKEVMDKTLSRAGATDMPVLKGPKGVH